MFFDRLVLVFWDGISFKQNNSYNNLLQLKIFGIQIAEQRNREQFLLTKKSVLSSKTITCISSVEWSNYYSLLLNSSWIVRYFVPIQATETRGAEFGKKTGAYDFSCCLNTIEIRTAGWMSTAKVSNNTFFSTIFIEKNWSQCIAMPDWHVEIVRIFKFERIVSMFKIMFLQNYRLDRFHKDQNRHLWTVY